jgi:pimeloyl-ACP methyl ester carboxylesterase
VTAPSYSTAIPSNALRRCARIAGILAGIYVLVAVALLCSQDRLAFIGWTMPKPWLEPPAGAAVEEFTLSMPDGNTVHAWWMPPRGWTPEKGAVLYLHGNGGNLSTCGKTMWQWTKELKTGVLGLDYPGFGRSTGTPSEENCYTAAQAAFDWLVHDRKVAAREIIVVGQSMGGAVATELATRRPCRMLLTSGAFATFPEVAQHQFPWLPVRPFIDLQFDNVSKMGRLETPVFITHGTEDHVVPYSHSKRLYNAAINTPRRFFPTPGHGHSQPKTAEFYEAVRKFLRKTEPTREASEASPIQA